MTTVTICLLLWAVLVEYRMRKLIREAIPKTPPAEAIAEASTQRIEVVETANVGSGPAFVATEQPERFHKVLDSDLVCECGWTTNIVQAMSTHKRVFCKTKKPTISPTLPRMPGSHEVDGEGEGL